MELENIKIGFQKIADCDEKIARANEKFERASEKIARADEKIEKPGKQFLRIQYNPPGKVEALYGPLETLNEAPLFKFSYHKGLTKVQDAIGQLTVYSFDDHQRISDIRYVDLDNRVIRKDSFLWSHNENEAGWLKSKSIGLADQLYYLKSYEYDRRGNVKQETLYGNLTGKNKESFQESDKKKMDHSSITCEYSDDGLNLLTKKSTDEGLTIAYEYLKGTNLCTKVLTHYQGKIQERIFRHYDDNGEVQSLIEDDGSSDDENNFDDVTYRKIKLIESVKKKGTSFGKPGVIKEFYRNKQTGDSILLHQTFFSYDEQGCEKEQVVIDAKGKRYISSKEYDGYLQLRKETNALGKTTVYDYDENGNKISEELIGSGKKILYVYDFANRLKEKTEIHEEIDQTFITTYQSNALNQLMSETDPYGQTTTYCYDRMGNQTVCTKPPIQDSFGGILYPTVVKEYNLLNQMISITDENRAVIQYRYNVYGQPTKIIYPDNSKEKFFYTPCGWLKEKVHPDGTSISYDYDGKGHLTKQTFKDAEGQPIKTEEFHYKGPLLQWQKDGMGLITAYEYDEAGRKIKETIGNLKIIHYRYDDFDRLIERQEDVRVETTAYDAIGRPIEKQRFENGNLLSKESYHYDIQGNLKKSEVAQTSDQTAIYKSHFRSEGLLKWKENPLGDRTDYAYDHRFPYALGQYVKTRTITDSLGRPTVETYDPFDRVVKREIFDRGQSVSRTEWAYDGAGHCTKEHSFVMASGQPIGDYWIEKCYNKRGLLKEEKEISQEKRTIYRYDEMRRLKQKIKPDGVEIYYTYDVLGRLKTLKSSDGGIDYTYHYDLHDNVTHVIDGVKHITQNRLFDLYSRLEKEEISPGMTIAYEYDPLDRLKKLTLPDRSSIGYIYQGHLNTIQRIDPNEVIRYTIECPSYDLRGNLLEFRSPAGVIQTTYDLVSRKVKIDSPSWECHLEQFDAVGNLSIMRQRDPTGVINGQYSYDRLNYLTAEVSHEQNQYAYDSLGNCLAKNEKPHQINSLNQLTNNGEGDFLYDLNGNLKQDSSQQADYEYDALNRLISCEKGGCQTTFIYDAFGRCLEIADGSGFKRLLYQGEQEIGSRRDEQLQEFRLVHPDDRYDLTFAIELNGQTLFPIQDSRSNICALQKPDGSLAEWSHYSAFGSKIGQK